MEDSFKTLTTIAQNLDAENSRLRARVADLEALMQSHVDRACELARLRAEVARLIAAWPTGDEDRIEPIDVVWISEGVWWVYGRKIGPYPTRQAAVRAAAGLDAGDGPAPATHGEGETR
jgi:hypothetical protein